MLKFRFKTLTGYESWKCMYTSCPGWPFGGSYEHSSQTKTYLFPPACNPPTYNWRSAGQLAGPVHENGQHITTQSIQYHRPQPVRYHKLPPPSRLRPATSQARLHGVLGRKSMYVGQWIGRTATPSGLDSRRNFSYCRTKLTTVSFFYSYCGMMTY